MALTAEQRAIIERRLPIGRVEEGTEEPVQISLGKRELRFVLQAIACYRDTQCTVAGASPECDMVFWYEAPQGHIERACEHFCDQLVNKLIAQVPERR